MVTSSQNGVEKSFPRKLTHISLCVWAKLFLLFLLLFHLTVNKIRKRAHKLLKFNHIVLERTAFRIFFPSHLYNFIFHFHLTVFRPMFVSVIFTAIFLVLVSSWIKNNDGYELYKCTCRVISHAISFRHMSRMVKNISLAAASALLFPRKQRKQRSIYYHHLPSFIDPASMHTKCVGETEIATILLSPGHLTMLRTRVKGMLVRNVCGRKEMVMFSLGESSIIAPTMRCIIEDRGFMYQR